MSQAVSRAAWLEIRPTGAEVRRASSWLTSLAQATGLSGDASYRLELCLNEALANVIEHGGEQALGSTVRLIFSAVGEGEALKASLTISDAGLAFSPLTVSPGEPAGELADAQPGGLGLMMLRQFADELTYVRSQGRNELTLQVRG